MIWRAATSVIDEERTSCRCVRVPSSPSRGSLLPIFKNASRVLLAAARSTTMCSMSNDTHREPFQIYWLLPLHVYSDVKIVQEALVASTMISASNKNILQDYETLLQGVTSQGMEFCEMLDEQFLIAAKSRVAQVSQAMLIVRRSLGNDAQGWAPCPFCITCICIVAETFRPLGNSTTSYLRLVT